MVVGTCRWLPAALLIVWMLICAHALRTDARFFVTSTTGIGDERRFYVDASHRLNPVTIDDYRFSSLPWARAGHDAASLAARGKHGLLLDGFNPLGPRLTLSSSAVEARIVAAVPNIGMYGYAAGTDVFVADRLGLADPLGSRIRITRRLVAGHEKLIGIAWVQARFTSPALTDPPEVRDARRALRCGDLPELLSAVTGGFGPGRARHNFWDAFTLTALRFPRAPDQAVRDLCATHHRKS